MHFEADNLRILGPHSWRDVVHLVSRSVPIVVLDTRTASPAVVEETNKMTQDPFQEKTLFVVADDGSAPSIAATGRKICLTVYRTARLRDVVSALKDMGLSKTTSPDDSHLLAKVSFARHSKRLERGMVAVARASMPFATVLETIERVNGSTPFVMAARKLQERLNGKPGDGALEVFAQLSGDIAETERFITEWRNEDGHDLQNVIARVIAIHGELCQLQQAIDQAPPAFMQRNEENLRSLRRD
jgi:hypothetical protein